MGYRELFFDLDGTISDSAEGILNSVIYALHRMGIEPPPREALYRFIGPPLIRSFLQGFDLSEEEARRAVALYRENYNVRGIYECWAYEGIGKALRELKARGYRLTLATCKPWTLAERVLEHLGLRDCFAFVSGPELDGTRNEKHEVIAHAMDRLGIGTPAEILMIGDRRDDVLGAKRCDIDCIGVLWGFGSREELLEAGAIGTIETPADLLAFLTKADV